MSNFLTKTETDNSKTYRTPVEYPIRQPRSHYEAREQTETLVTPHPFSLFTLWGILCCQDASYASQDWDRHHPVVIRSNDTIGSLVEARHGEQNCR